MDKEDVVCITHTHTHTHTHTQALLVAQLVKNLPAMPETWVRSLVLSERSPEEGNGYLLQYSCLESSMNRGAWWATVHEDTKSRT